MEWIAANVVADSVKIMSHVTMSVGYAQVVVRTGILEPIVITVKLFICSIILDLHVDRFISLLIYFIFPNFLILIFSNQKMSIGYN